MSIQKIQQHYNEFANIYDDRYDSPRGKIYHQHLCNHLIKRLPNKKILLDIGCGTGLFMNQYVVGGGRAVGIDISSGMVHHGRQRCPENEFCIGTANMLPFQDATFDAITSLLAFSYIPDPDTMLRESYRVLKPGGQIAICTLSRTVLTSIVPLAYRIGEQLKIKSVCVGDFGEHYYTNDEMTSLLLKAGFKKISVSRCTFAHIGLADPIFKLTRMVEPIIEEKFPSLAYNVCVTGQKPNN
jgi:ubiquinone/menaquinone biosynthesis C-methylase UbiE